MTRRTWHDVMPSMPGTWHDVAFMSFYMALMPSDVALMPSDLAGLGHGKWEISGSLRRQGGEGNDEVFSVISRLVEITFNV